MHVRTAVAVIAVLAVGCLPEGKWQVASTGLDEALMSVTGTSASDVWAVGADVASGPLVLHYDGTTWERRVTGTRGHLWWAQAFPDGSVFMAGERGTILKWSAGTFTNFVTPGMARQTVFGLWGSSPKDIWAVGSATNGRNGFAWHFDGTEWTDVALPDDMPRRNGETPGLFKVWGTSATDVWMVGADGLILRRRGATWSRVESGHTDTLFTVWGGVNGTVYIAGGGATATLLEHTHRGLRDVSPASVALVQGVTTFGTMAYVAGEGGAVFRRDDFGWSQVKHGLALDVESLHGAWADPSGGIWAVGGKVVTTLKGGAIIHFGAAVSNYVQPEKPTPPAAICPSAEIDPAEGKSVARRWNEQILSAIRRDLPRPTVHARNLYHLSAAMWDAWAAYGSTAQGVFFHERLTASDAAQARDEAISYAAYRLLDKRYTTAVNGAVSHACFQALLRKQGFNPDNTSTTGTSPSAVGNRIGQAIIDATANDGANEQNNYADTTGFVAANAPLSVEGVMQPVSNIDLWQPLDLAVAATQNGIPVAPGVQGYIGAQWRAVTPFALTRATPTALYSDAGEPPRITPATMSWAVEVIRRSAQLQPENSVTIDISPGAFGNNPLGTNAGTGHPLNPVTQQPYAPNVVPRGDFGRVLAEFWADGPKSETPPGHWNVLANQVADHAAFQRKWQGQGAVLTPLEWDVKLYLALNGAVHDAAIAAWEVKRVFLCSRPITIIRASALKGQSSDPSAPHYDVNGLPLEPGLIELITDASSAPGQRHAHLRAFIGDIAIRAWRGEPANVKTQLSGTGWVRAVEWVPYQKRNFVTPAFPGFISGHSTFSRAAAEVMTAATGSAFFPGGLASQVVAQDVSLTFEKGPSVPVTLQWATYFDAADQAGQSRIWGGIHIEPDDFAGRRVGEQVGKKAFAKAMTFF